MKAKVFTIPWGSPREVIVEPIARSMPSLEHSTADKIIAERQMTGADIDSHASKDACDALIRQALSHWDSQILRFWRFRGASGPLAVQ
jgi:hypothetical protein